MFLFERKFATWPGENGGTNDTKSFFFLWEKLTRSHHIMRRKK
jgi:hypothetical protein